MPFYRVAMRGLGIRMAGEPGTPPAIGFYTTRIARGATEDEAAQRATRQVTAQWTEGEYAKSNLGAMPSVSVESITRTSFLEALLFRGSGHIFYGAKEDGA